jgi:hypothetical protein
MARSKAIKLLVNIFPESQFSIRTRIREEVKLLFNPETTHMEKSEELYFLLRYLEKELGKAKKKLSRTIRLHKKGEATIEEVQDHEFNVFEIQTQIEDIRSQLGY